MLAVVELDASASASPAMAEALIAHARSRLARFKCPRSIEFVDVLPRQDNGKVYRKVLRDRFTSAAERSG